MHIGGQFILGLRAKILLLLSLMLVLLSGVATIKAYRSYEDIKLEKQAGFLWATRWIESEEKRHLGLAQMLSFMVTHDVSKGMTEKVCRQGYSGAAGLDPEFGHLAIADAKGNISCNSIPWLHDKNIADQRYFFEAMKLNDQSFIDEADNENPRQYAAILARTMRDNHGRATYVVLVEMDFSWIKEEVDMTQLPSSGHLLVVDANGTLIGGSANVSDWVDKNISATAFYKQVLASGDKSFEGSGFDDSPSYIVAHEFSTGSGRMRVIIDVPREYLLQPAYHSIANTLIVSLAIFAAMLVFAYFMSDRHFLRKILAIDRAAKKIGQGDMSARAKLSGNDELGRLSRTFDEMAESLQVKEEKIKEATDELYRVNRALRVLSAGNKSLLFAKTEEELLVRVCREIVEEGGYLAAWIGFAGPAQDEYLRTMASFSKAESESDRIDWNKASNGMKPVISSVREDKVLIINDTSHESVHRQLAEQAMKFGYRSIIVLPLHLEGKPFGALILTAYRDNEFGGLQVEYLRETASDISFGIEMLRTRGEKDRLAQLGEHHELLLRNSLEDALSAIALTIEMRDPYTSGHQRRVASLAKALALELGLAADEAHGIYLASIVHDIGKVNVPAEILVKPGRLNDIEYALVKTHVESSYQILKGIKFPWPIAEMAHQHHERLDGSGYPLGLKGGEISFGGRIMAVADVVEAMSTHRPYRASLGMDVALNEIEKGRDIIYDAMVVDACLRLFREGRFRFE